MTTPTSLACAGCGWMAPAVREQPFPFRCDRRGSGDDVDHVLVRVLDPMAVPPPGSDPNPFVRYRWRLHSYHVARSLGFSDDEYVGLVRRLDASIAQVDGHGFRVTPWRRCARLSERLGFSATGGVWVKDETGNVSGSHKARHLMGIMLYLEAVRRAGFVSSRAEASARSTFGFLASGPQPLVPGPWPPGPALWTLAIASCGNAALAAAVVAGAAGWPLDVFVPPTAEPAIVARLRDLGARVTICERRAGEIGDPSYLRFQEALNEGALPFCVQGSDNGLTIEGGETLAWEMIDAGGEARIDRLFVQVGGGALATSCVQAFNEARAFGAVDRPPRLHAVQTQGGYPLARAHRLVSERIAARGQGDPAVIGAELRYARSHRSQFMWPWEHEPRSIAHGILDDETYDWAAVVEGMLRTGGSPIVVNEETLEAANALAREATGVNVDHTGSAGLAGLMELQGGPVPLAADERIAVIFSGAKRAAAPGSPGQSTPKP